MLRFGADLGVLRRPIGAIGLVIAFMLLGTGPAAADLLISPLRVVFEARTRSVTVVVTNQSQETKTYRLEWAEKRAKPDGQYEDVPEPDPTMPISSKLVQFSPRQVTLAPGESQQVRVALRAPADLPAGEYRSHLSFVSIGQPQRQASRRQQQGGAGIEVFLNLGFAIPVIVRHGTAAEPAAAQLAGAQFRLDELNRVNLIVDIARRGAFSPYGRLRVFLREQEGAPERQIGMLNNVAMFPEVDTRRNAVVVTESAIDRGIVRVVYEGADEYAGRTWFDQSFRVGG
jgi:fimbrial chaperone protein